MTQRRCQVHLDFKGNWTCEPSECADCARLNPPLTLPILWSGFVRASDSLGADSSWEASLTVYQLGVESVLVKFENGPVAWRVHSGAWLDDLVRGDEVQVRTREGCGCCSQTVWLTIPK